MLKAWDIQFLLADSVGKTLHAKLLNRITTDIQNGRLTPGCLLPGSRSLAEQLGINRKTVQQVYEELEVQGWLKSKLRSGTFVSEILPEQNLSAADASLINLVQKTKPSSKLVKNLYSDALALADCIAITNDGTPDVRLIPYDLLARTYRRVCVNLSRHAKLGYGDPRGAIELRSSIQKMLASDRFMHCSVQEICVVRGSQMGIYLASRIIDPKKGAIIMEELCYLPAQAAFEANGFTVIKCRLDEQGLDITYLREILASHEVSGVYVTPHHQYPTTVCLPMHRRLALLDLSKSYQFSIIEDDYDHEFHYETHPIPPLASLPNSENVIHIGSMSKVLAPGIRLGYLVSGTQFIERAAQEIVLIDRQGNTITEHVIADLMESGEIKRHIRKVRREYKDRRNHAAQEFIRFFGNNVSFALPTGGLAIWVDISQLVEGSDLSGLQNSDSILSTYFAGDQKTATHIRFGFGALNLDEITKVIKKLSQHLIR
ncbi:GntR family transcriptional regulator [Shewanella sp. WE21]|jgi:GntR family transcriptional regulator/MocR family aminotransferase|uniref:MocR-like pyridoxine biosynthesis transcription factor PdxR n=1 Tax=Shewanella sp. WE21 TaxID=2029986 RepID=UPI000CF69781|nr:PLP-dependent aminotransferase family protein [Shewanella sp. WE21]AVI67719.1 GntR family transcriptional regulator [Shewanella sp. WE21]